SSLAFNFRVSSNATVTASTVSGGIAQAGGVINATTIAKSVTTEGGHITAPTVEVGFVKQGGTINATTFTDGTGNESAVLIESFDGGINSVTTTNIINTSNLSPGNNGRHKTVLIGNSGINPTPPGYGGTVTAQNIYSTGATGMENIVDGV